MEFKGLGKDGLIRGSAGGTGFSWRVWSPGVQDNKSLPSERILMIKFQSRSCCLVSGNGSGCYWRSKFFPQCMRVLHDLMVLFFCPWKTTRYVVRNRVMPVWAGSVVTMIPKKISNNFLKTYLKPRLCSLCPPCPKLLFYCWFAWTLCFMFGFIVS